MSSTSEIQNFISKFHQLMKAGQTAHLDLDTHAGQAWIGLKVMIRPLQPQQNQHHSSRKSRNPAYYRRQERRKALRKAAKASTEPSDTNAEEAAKASTKPSDTNAEEAIVPDTIKETIEEVPNNNVSEKVTNTDDVIISENLAAEVIDDNSETFTTISNTNEVKTKGSKASNTDISMYTTEKDIPPRRDDSYFCELCDFVCNSKRGFNVHMTRKHSKIEQLDGNISYIETEVSNLNSSDNQSEPYSGLEQLHYSTKFLELLETKYGKCETWDHYIVKSINENYTCKRFLSRVIVEIRDILISIETDMDNEITEFKKHKLPDLKTKSKKKSKHSRKYSPCDDEDADYVQYIRRDIYLLVCKEFLIESICPKVSASLHSMDKELEDEIVDLQHNVQGDEQSDDP